MYIIRTVCFCFLYDKSTKFVLRFIINCLNIQHLLYYFAFNEFVAQRKSSLERNNYKQSLVYFFSLMFAQILTSLYFYLALKLFENFFESNEVKK